MSHEELVKLPDGVPASLIYGKGGKNLKEITAKLPGRCEIAARVCLTQVMNVLVCVCVCACAC